MNKNQLNRAVKKLWAAFRQSRSADMEAPDYWSLQEEMKAELERLYLADTSLAAFNQNNLLRMLRMNVALRAVAFHQFGLMVNENKLD